MTTKILRKLSQAAQRQAREAARNKLRTANPKPEGTGTASKTRQKLAGVGKRGQDMMTSLAAKKNALKKMQKEGAAADKIERAKNAIADMENKMGPILKKKVKDRKVKPIPKSKNKRPAKQPQQKPPAEKRPISAGLIAAARAAKTPTFTYRGKKYSRSVIMKGAK